MSMWGFVQRRRKRWPWVVQRLWHRWGWCWFLVARASYQVVCVGAGCVHRSRTLASDNWPRRSSSSSECLRPRRQQSLSAGRGLLAASRAPAGRPAAGRQPRSWPTSVRGSVRRRRWRLVAVLGTDTTSDLRWFVRCIELLLSLYNATPQRNWGSEVDHIIIVIIIII